MSKTLVSPDPRRDVFLLRQYRKPSEAELAAVNESAGIRDSEMRLLDGHVMPQQFADMFRAPISPEKELQVAILQQAFYEIVGKASAREKQRQADIDWLHDRQDWGPTSCAGICASLDIEQTSLVAAIMTWKEHHDLSELTTARFGTRTNGGSMYLVQRMRESA